MIELKVIENDRLLTLTVAPKSNLRRTLLDNGFTPYAIATQQLNCRGRGICATCGVKVLDGEPAPEHWHDKLAKRFRYPRLSCQIYITEPMTIEILTDKWVWGARLERENE